MLNKHDIVLLNLLDLLHPFLLPLLVLFLGAVIAVSAIIRLLNAHVFFVENLLVVPDKLLFEVL